MDMQEVFDSLNANKILIGILEQVKEVSVPISFFTDVSDRQLEVKSNSEMSEFIFSLRNKDEW